MKTGTKNKLTGQIGEHLVSAKLGTMGYYATPFSGNVPGFDVIATNADTLESVPIQIKTANTDTLVHSKGTTWVDIKVNKKGEQRLGQPVPLAHPNVIWVVVLIKNHDITTARYFIATAAQIQAEVIRHYQEYLDKHNSIRPRNPESLHTALRVADLIKFEDNWNLLGA